MKGPSKLGGNKFSGRRKRVTKSTRIRDRNKRQAREPNRGQPLAIESEGRPLNRWSGKGARSADTGQQGDKPASKYPRTERRGGRTGAAARGDRSSIGGSRRTGSRDPRSALSGGQGEPNLLEDKVAPKRKPIVFKPDAKVVEGVYLLRTIPGLAKLAVQELKSRRVINPVDQPGVTRQRNHDLLFLKGVTHADRLQQLRLSEQALRCLAYGRFKISDTQLSALGQFLKATKENYRVVVTVDGPHFQRQDFKRWISKNLELRGAKIVDDEDAKELWVFCIDQSYYIGTQTFRSSEAKYRLLRKVDREGSLPQTVAAAMVFYAQPAAGETLLDPCCGSGTLLAEAYSLNPEVKLAGIDSDKKAVQATRSNLSFIKSYDLKTADARDTKMPADSVDVVVTNLPFGKQFGDPTTNPELYEGILREMNRVGRASRWRGVMLTSDVNAFETAAASAGVRIDRHFMVKLRGVQARVYLVSGSRKKSGTSGPSEVDSGEADE